ncbi:MAG: AraC family transcriptional regulator [Bacteroidales bacterium]|jgi:AraC-like DNA-binding protein|nr:AraC family transcriptional regulator [Bacteroidales bacterium]
MESFQKEITPVSPDDLFIVLDHPDADFNYPVHYHSEYEINLVLNSYGERIVGDSKESFDHMDLVMIGPDLPHAWRGKVVKGNHVITIQFANDLLNFEILKKNQFNPVKKLLVDSRRGLVFPPEVARSVGRQILKLTRMQGFHTTLQFFSILNELALADRTVLISNQFDTFSTKSGAKSRRITKVCDYVEAHISEEIRLREVSDLVNMSESAFSHFFRKKTNTTFISYVNNIRIGKACQLLSNTTMTISEICFACGFNNQANFIRIFRKNKGDTPGAYRNYIQQILLKY